MKHWVYIETGQPSPPELETLNLLMRGATYAEVAEARHRSKKTVENTVKRLMAETESKNSRELIYKALAHGWIEPPKRYVD